MIERISDGVAALAEHGRLPLELAGRPYVAVRHEGGVTVVEALCPHRGGPLPAGDVLEGLIVCPWHRSVFRLADGACVAGPARRPAGMLPARVEGNDLLVEYDPAAGVVADG